MSRRRLLISTKYMVMSGVGGIGGVSLMSKKLKNPKDNSENDYNAEPVNIYRPEEILDDPVMVTPKQSQFRVKLQGYLEDIARILDLVEEIIEENDPPKTKPFVIFVHGIWRDPKKNWEKIKLIDDDLDPEPKGDMISIVYEWPSNSLKLDDDGIKTSKRSGIGLEVLVTELITHGYKDISIIAHSMGSRVVCTAMKELYNTIQTRKKTKENKRVTFSDVDQLKLIFVAGEAYPKDLKEIIRLPLGRKIHVTNYYNKLDWALTGAAIWRFFTTRKSDSIGSEAVFANDDKYNDNIVNINCSDIVSIDDWNRHNYFKPLIDLDEFNDIVFGKHTDLNDRLQRKSEKKRYKKKLKRDSKFKNKNAWILKDD